MTIELSEFMARHRGAIIESWAAKVRAELLRRSLSEEQLLDALQLFLDEVIAALQRSGGPLVSGGPCAVARAHGRQRQTLRHHISEVVREYGLLFECVLGLAERAGVALEPAAVLELARCLCSGAAEAVDEYAEKSQAERRHADFETFAFLAHEIRNPLSTAALSWELIRRSRGLSDASAERLGRSLETLRERVDQTLLHSRLAMVGAGAPLHLETVSLQQLLQDAAEDSAALAESKRIRLRLDLESDASLQADARLLRSALTNLVRNGVKFSREDGSVSLRGRAGPGLVHIEIDDECGGLPPERVERLFESFMQAGAERSGFGLGLAIVRQAVEAHGGTVEVKNRAGRGCTFSVELPDGAEDPPAPPPARA